MEDGGGAASVGPHDVLRAVRVHAFSAFESNIHFIYDWLLNNHTARAHSNSLPRYSSVLMASKAKAPAAGLSTQPQPLKARELVLRFTKSMDLSPGPCDCLGAQCSRSSHSPPQRLPLPSPPAKLPAPTPFRSPLSQFSSPQVFLHPSLRSLRTRHAIWARRLAPLGVLITRVGTVRRRTCARVPPLAPTHTRPFDASCPARSLSTSRGNTVLHLVLALSLPPSIPGLPIAAVHARRGSCPSQAPSWLWWTWR